ncbi:MULTISPECIES: hypothetical protein [unclassified Mesorhizobium]|uniref:hypothetical protein n=1 Tax=unclassified Mesorhizobium TaxID=325217 RepID=UPI003334D9AB
MQAATRSSWKTLPLPAQQDRIDLALLYSDAEGEKIRLGHVPRDMDDKWFIFFENGWLYFHRSWTGACIYGVRLEGSPNGIRVTDAWVSGDKEWYQSPGPEHDARLIQQLISGRLLS